MEILGPQAEAVSLGRPGPDRDIVLILIDQESLDVYEKAAEPSLALAAADLRRPSWIIFKAGRREGGLLRPHPERGLALRGRGRRDLSRGPWRGRANVFLPFFLSDEAKDMDEVRGRPARALADPPAGRSPRGRSPAATRRRFPSKSSSRRGRRRGQCPVRAGRGRHLPPHAPGVLLSRGLVLPGAPAGAGGVRRGAAATRRTSPWTAQGGA